MAVLVDTDLLVEQERGADVLNRLAPGEDRYISVITMSELLHGVHRAVGARRVQRQAFVESVLQAVEPVPITPPIARIDAEIWAGLSRSGSRIGDHDLWIAATAIAHGFGVATLNAVEFRRVPGLRVLGAS